MTGLEQMVKWLEKEPDFIYKDYKDIRTAKMMSFKACIDKARALLAEEQSQPPANADLVGLLELLRNLGEKERAKLANPQMIIPTDDDKVRYGEIRGIYRMEKSIEDILSRYRHAVGTKEKI